MSEEDKTVKLIGVKPIRNKQGEYLAKEISNERSRTNLVLPWNPISTRSKHIQNLQPEDFYKDCKNSVQ